MKDILIPETPERNPAIQYLTDLEPILESGLEKFSKEANIPEKKTIRKLKEDR